MNYDCKKCGSMLVGVDFSIDRDTFIINCFECKHTTTDKNFVDKLRKKDYG